MNASPSTNGRNGSRNGCAIRLRSRKTRRVLERWIHIKEIPPAKKIFRSIQPRSPQVKITHNAKGRSSDSSPVPAGLPDYEISDHKSAGRPRLRGIRAYSSGNCSGFTPDSLLISPAAGRKRTLYIGKYMNLFSNPINLVCNFFGCQRRTPPQACITSGFGSTHHRTATDSRRSDRADCSAAHRR